jgi:hypothetical protein
MKKILCRVSGSRQRIIGALAKRPSTTTRTGRIWPMIPPAVAGRRSIDQRLTAPSSPLQAKPYYIWPFPFLPSTTPNRRRRLPSPTSPPFSPSTAAPSTCHLQGPLRRHSRVAPLLPPPLAPHLVARSSGGARRGGGGSGPPARPPSRRNFLAASRHGSGGGAATSFPARI